MKVKDILEFLCEVAPLDTACDFDNVGLLIGDAEKEVLSCVVALDCTEKTVKTAIEKGAQLIITHHPVIFNPLKKVLKGDVVHTLIENGISVISMHTNLDVATNGINDVLANALELENVIPLIAEDGFVLRMGELSKPLTADSFAEFVKQKLNTPVKYVGENTVKKVAVCSGSGADFLFCAKENGADALLTSECKHHLFLEAAKQDITLADAGHFNTEDIIVEPLCEILTKQFPKITFIAEHFNYIKTCT